MRWFVPDFVIKRVLWFLTGTQAGMNHHVGALPRKYLGGRMCSLINLLKRCRTQIDIGQENEIGFWMRLGTGTVYWPPRGRSVGIGLTRFIKESTRLVASFPKQGKAEKTGDVCKKRKWNRIA
jgi:hypothetical protein